MNIPCYASISAAQEAERQGQLDDRADAIERMSEEILRAELQDLLFDHEKDDLKRRAVELAEMRLDQIDHAAKGASRFLRSFCDD